jgi:hypothetical protein
VHSNFLIIVWSKAKLDLEYHRKGVTNLDRDKKEDIFLELGVKDDWIRKVGGLRIGIIESLKKSESFYETEIIEESLELGDYNLPKKTSKVSQA